MISMIINLNVEVAEIAGNICGYSTECVRNYMAFSIITSMAAYSCLDDNSYLVMSLSSLNYHLILVRHDSLLHDENL